MTGSLLDELAPRYRSPAGRTSCDRWGTPTSSAHRSALSVAELRRCMCSMCAARLYDVTPAKHRTEAMRP